MRRLLFLTAMLWVALVAPRAHAGGGDDDDSTCPDWGTLHPMHCYGTVQVGCFNGIATYRVVMAPGYLCSRVIVYAESGQSLKKGIPASGPAGWACKTYGTDRVSWKIPVSKAVNNASDFRVTFTTCGTSQRIGLQVVPIPSQHPYMPRGETFVFFATAGCLTDVQGSTWGQIRGIYR